MVNYWWPERHQRASTFMRHQRLLVYPVLLCALVLSGWGSVLAAALCPHAASRAAAASVEAGVGVDDDHACCHADAEGAGEHCSGSKHEATGESKATHAHGQRAQATKPLRQALAPSESSCSHCVGHSSLPVAPARFGEPSRPKHDAHRPAQDEAKPVAPPVIRFVSSIAPTQGAPPGPAARKHLLLSIFLI